MTGYCHSCGTWGELNRYTAMCADCADVWSDTRGRTVSDQIDAILAGAS